MSLDNLTILTYTHSNAKDLHAPYFGRLDKHFPHPKGLILCDFPVSHSTFGCHVYDDLQPFWQQITSGLDRVDTEYVLYMQEDYILHGDWSRLRIKVSLDYFRRDEELGFFRLIWSGMDRRNFTYYLPYYAAIPRKSEYFYSSQATIWRTDVLKSMFLSAKPQRITDELVNSPVLRDMQVKGICHYEVGRKIGGHYEDPYFPYIATAKVKGQWNTAEYPTELEELWQKYPACRP